MLLRPRWKPNTTTARSLHAISYMSRQKICIVALLHLHLDFKSRHLITTWIGFGFVFHPSMGQDRKSFLRLYNHIWFITLIIQHWWATQVIDVCTIQCKENNTGCTDQMTFIWLWEIVPDASEIGRARSNYAPNHYSRQVTHWTFLRWTPREHFRRRHWQPLCTCNDGSLFSVNRSRNEV